jgi:hypothetical protein
LALFRRIPIYYWPSMGALLLASVSKIKEGISSIGMKIFHLLPF